MRCINCGSDDVTDYNEFGCPGGFRYFCNGCHYLWGKLVVCEEPKINKTRENAVCNQKMEVK
jgi:hypothetical protein